MMSQTLLKFSCNLRAKAFIHRKDHKELLRKKNSVFFTVIEIAPKF